MHAEPSTIYFFTQLRCLPIDELRFGKSFVRDLYSALAKPGGYTYENLSIQSDPPTMSTKKTTPRGEGVSLCRIQPDSIAIEETDPELHLDQFLEVVHTVLGTAAEIKKNTAPVFLQRCVFRCLVKTKSANSITLLAGKVSNVLKSIAPFERPPMFFGIRFRFPPFEIEQPGNGDPAEDGEKRHDFASVRFETWSKDVGFVWIEVDANYFFEEPININGIERIERNIKDAHQFITEKCLNFLDQFDDLPEPIEDDDEEEEEEPDEE